MSNPIISVVSPVYGCPGAISELCERLDLTLTKIAPNYEIILVEDGSPDNSWKNITEQCEKNSRIVGIRLSRNFGQHYAITAGISKAKGEWIVVMDCDLQDRPEEIPALYAKAIEGFDLVFARRVNRQDSFFKKATSKLFYSVFSYMTDSKQDAAISNFGIFNQNVINSVLLMRDKVRFFPTMTQWVGYRSTAISVDHDCRLEGKSSYSLHKLLKLAIDNMIAFSDKPLRITVGLGIYVSFASFILAIFYLLRYLYGGIIVSGFTSLILSIWFLSGLIILMLGVIGLYISRIFNQVKNRPTFIIKEIVNSKGKK